VKKDFRYHMKQRGGMLAKGPCSASSLRRCFWMGCMRRSPPRGRAGAADRDGSQGARLRAVDRFPDQSGVSDSSAGSLQSLANEFGYAFWQRYDETSDVVRFCTSWATPPELVDALLDAIPAKHMNSIKNGGPVPPFFMLRGRRRRPFDSLAEDAPAEQREHKKTGHEPDCDADGAVIRQNVRSTASAADNSSAPAASRMTVRLFRKSRRLCRETAV
jgi:hypothetical protein